MKCNHATGCAARRKFVLKNAVLIAACFVVSHACAMQPRSDLFVHLSNASGVVVSVCNANDNSCKTLLPGETTIEKYATGRPHVTFIGEWIADYSVRLCGKSVPLQSLISEPAISEDWYSLTFHLTMSRKNYERECGQMEPKRAARR